MTLYLILIGKVLNNYQNSINLKLIKIYLITDNKNELKKRLINKIKTLLRRLKKRFKSFDEDIKHWKDYDYIIINKNLDVCFRQIENIIKINKEEFSIASQIASVIL